MISLFEKGDPAMETAWSEAPTVGDLNGLGNLAGRARRRHRRPTAGGVGAADIGSSCVALAWQFAR
jgi:hypothetical protein